VFLFALGHKRQSLILLFSKEGVALAFRLTGQTGVFAVNTMT